MDLSNDRIPFPKKEYRVSEVVEIAATYCGIYLEDKKSTDKLFRALAQRIRDELHKIEDEEGFPNTQQRNTYPGDWVDRVVNTTLAKYFKKVEAGQKNSLRKEWKRLAEEYTENFETYQDEENEYMRGLSAQPLNKGAELLFSTVEDYKQKILSDIVFKYLIELDEGLLQRDAEVSLTFSDNHLPTPEDMGAMERLKDLSNYYKWRSKKLEDLFKD